jgi:phenylalanyl-tRNA synthetase alpha chain
MKADLSQQKGHLHPISHIIEKTESIFKELGFAVATGPEIETEYYNFDALNIPAHHPARDMWDTFWLKQTNNQQPTTNNNSNSNSDSDGKLSVVDGQLLRTHTSPVQIRYTETHKPPIRIIVPGKTFRHEATDSTHEAQFFQLEGLMIEEDVSLANLKYVLEYYFEKLFGEKTPVRFRPSFFPFTEPSVEIDMFYKDKWLEIMGAGMVHPKVLASMGIDSRKYRGFAFGGGIDRLAMLKFGITDIRMFYDGDLRMINQF